MTTRLAPGAEAFGAMPDGRAIHRVRIGDDSLQVAVLTLGAILQDVRLAGVDHGLAVGTEDPAAYLGPMRSCGALIGPVVNRISGGAAELDGTRHHFERNQDGQMTRHSGSAGTHRKLWQIGQVAPDAITLELSLPDGEGGFPGNRVVAARYALTEPGTLELRVAVTTDADTWVNFANHSYWSLDGGPTYDGHRLQVAADRFCVPGPGDLVTGEVQPVEGTPFDFREGQVMRPGEDARLDVNLCLAERRGAPRPVATLTGASGVEMAMETTEPGLQVYDGAGFDGADHAGHDGRRLGPYCGLALEAQGWPDAPNHRHFPSIVLREGHAYEQVTRWRFSR